MPGLDRVGAGLGPNVDEPGPRRLRAGLNSAPVELPALAILPTMAPSALLPPRALQLPEPPGAPSPVETP
jgi:hypothetical protein